MTNNNFKNKLLFRKRKNQQKRLAGLTILIFTIISLIVGVMIMVTAFLITLDANVRDPDIINWQGSLWVEILIAVGTSIVSSVIFFLIYSKTAEKDVLLDITESTADFTLSLFTNRYERMLPLRIFPETIEPTNEFDDHFIPLFTNSKTYKYKGDSGRFTSFQLIQLLGNKHHLDKEIKLLLLDPRERSAFEERAQTELIRSGNSYTRSDLIRKTDEIRNSVFVTLVTFFDICHRLNIEVAFYRGIPFFRTEIMDSGIFITYYLGGRFPETYLYGHSSLAYEAYLLNFQQNYEAATIRIEFNNRMSEEYLIKCLDELQCNIGLDDLRTMEKEYLNWYQQLVKSKKKSRKSINSSSDTSPDLEFDFEDFMLSPKK